jgi:hypothetical protein
MKLYPIAEKIIPVIAAILLLVSHQKNVIKQLNSIQDVVSTWK